MRIVRIALLAACCCLISCGEKDQEEQASNACPACEGDGLCAACSECPQCTAGDGKAACDVCGQMGIPFTCEKCNSTCACPDCKGTGKKS